ncbi:MAG: SseB family protein [Streptosporangiaceae bacterium]
MRSLASPAFPGDDGAADPAVRDAVDEYARTRQLGGVIEALGRARVLVPVVPLAGETPAGGDKEADMAAVMMTGADGRRALLAFSSLATLRSWDPQARPVPVTTPDAARAARSEGASAIVLDVAGPVRVVIETDDLGHLADGEVLVRTNLGLVWSGGRS